MIRVLSGRIEQMVGGDHIIDDIRFADLLGSELLWRAEILAVIISEMIVGHDRCRFDARADEEIHQDGFHLRLTRFEIITTDENTMTLGELNDTRNQRILRRTIDVRASLKDRRHGENIRRGHFSFTALNATHHLLRRHVESGAHIDKSLGVCRPQHDDGIEFILRFEVANIATDVVQILQNTNPNHDAEGERSTHATGRKSEANTKKHANKRREI